MYRTLLSAALTAVLASAVASARDPVALTIYRNDSGSLFEGGGSPVADGYAIVHERRDVNLTGGRQTLTIDGLPSTLDTEAVALDLGAKARLLAQRVLSAGDSGLLAAHRGERIVVLGRDGNVMVQGALLSVDDNSLGVRADDGKVSYVRDFASVQFLEGNGLPGSTLQVSVDGTAGTVQAHLTYPTSGLGWRAAYSATLLPGTDCQVHLQTLASIANRSGRNYAGARIKLIAGEPNMTRGGSPRPMMKAAAATFGGEETLPHQGALGDYRSYTLPGSFDLPDASVSQLPLYTARDLPCVRSWTAETGYAGGFPPKPNVFPGNGNPGSGPIVSQLRFSAVENLPTGNLRVLSRDQGGQLEFLGEQRLGDTAKGAPVVVALGNAFGMTAHRERTAFSIDRTARQMNEGFRITLHNGSDAAHTISLREHPSRWRNWSLLSSSAKPDRQTPDLLEFQVAVPAGGDAALDYLIRYDWTATDEAE